MKVAVLVTGMYREFDTTIKSWDFMKVLDCDFYFSTWNKSIQKNSKLGIDLNEDITPDLITKHIPNAKINILNQSDYDFSSDTFYHNAKQIFHWKNALRMVKESGIDYDAIMITRTDNYIYYLESFENFNNFIKEDRIYGLTPIYISGPNQLFLMDYFFFGNFTNMSKMIETLPNEMPHNIHGDLARHLLSIELVVEELTGFNLCLARPNTRGLENLDIQTLHNKFTEWGINTGN